MHRSLAGAVLVVSLFPVAGGAQGTGSGLRGLIYSSSDLTGTPVTDTIHPQVDFDWGAGAPAGTDPAAGFSARWLGQVTPPAAGDYQFAVQADGGVRLWIDGKLAIDDWLEHGAMRNHSAPIPLAAGRKYAIQLDYYNGRGNAAVKLYWWSAALPLQLVPAAQLYPAAVTPKAAEQPVKRAYVSSLPFLAETNGLGPVERNRSNGGAAAGDGKNLTTAGARWPNGLGVHAESHVTIAIDDRFDRFLAYLGIDDSAGEKASAVFEVWVDGALKYRSPVMKRGMAALPISVSVENGKLLRLSVLNAGDGNQDDLADWGFARLDGMETVNYLSSMTWVSATNGEGPVERDLSNGGPLAKDGGKITLRGEVYAKGLGVKANSEIVYNLDGRFELFTAVLGIDDSAAGKGSVVFEIWGGTTLLHRSSVIKGDSPARHVAVSMRSRSMLTLKVLDAGDGNANDLAVWADAKLLPLGSDIAPGVLPGAPSQLTAAQGANGIQLAWTAGANTVGFSVLRALAPNSANPSVVDTNVLPASFLDTSARAGTTYYYRVVPVNPNGQGPASNEVSATMPAAGGTVSPPPAPSGLTAQAATDGINLAWGASAGAVSYRIMRGLSGDPLSQLAADVKATSYKDAAVSPGTTYFYRVIAVNTAGSSAPSNEASAKALGVLPPAPTGLTAQNSAVGQVTLKWNAVAGAQGYKLYRGTASNAQSATPIAANVSAAEYIDKTVAGGATYFYKVAAFNATGTGAMSNEASVTPLALPAAPTGLSATPGNRQVSLLWTAVPGATSYNVYRGTASNGQGTAAVATGITTPAYVNTGLLAGTAYYFKVTAVNANGESPRSAEASATPTAAPPPVDESTVSAVRFLRQSTWGPKPADVAKVKQIGRQAFLAEQFSTAPSVYPDSLYQQPVEYMQEHFFRLALTGPDQLRQRVAFALHQMWVVSAVEVDCNEAMIPYYRLLMNGAFGNYRELMTQMTLNPAMGSYLNMVNNRSQAITGNPPNENYGRELLQLFTLGLTRLNPDGTAQAGAPPAYSEEDVKELSRMLTGWTFGDGNASTVPTGLAKENYLVPMEAVERFHDNGAKTLLGVAVPAGLTARQDLDRALDIVFAQPTLGPFVCRHLIQRLVTSNPSAAYLRDVVAVFNDNGAGTRGDLRAVLEAILTHPEAGAASADGAKMMEPALFIVSQLRTLNATVSDHPFMNDLCMEMGQRVFYPPSVFSYFSPFFRVRGTPLFGPEFQIHTSVTALVRINFVGKLVSNGFGSDVAIDWTPFRSIAGDAAALVDSINTLFLGGTMPAEHRNAVIEAVQASPASSVNERTRTALYLTLAAAQYYVER